MGILYSSKPEFKNRLTLVGLANPELSLELGTAEFAKEPTCHLGILQELGYLVQEPAISTPSKYFSHHVLFFIMLDYCCYVYIYKGYVEKQS
jgi:hypothetical protein